MGVRQTFIKVLDDVKTFKNNIVSSYTSEQTLNPPIPGPNKSRVPYFDDPKLFAGQVVVTLFQDQFILPPKKPFQIIPFIDDPFISKSVQWSDAVINIPYKVKQSINVVVDNPPITVTPLNIAQWIDYNINRPIFKLFTNKPPFDIDPLNYSAPNLISTWSHQEPLPSPPVPNRTTKIRTPYYDDPIIFVIPPPPPVTTLFNSSGVALMRGMPTLIGLANPGTFLSTPFSILANPRAKRTVICQAIGSFTVLNGNIEASEDGGITFQTYTIFDFTAPGIFVLTCHSGILYRFNVLNMTETLAINIFVTMI